VEKEKGEGEELDIFSKCKKTPRLPGVEEKRKMKDKEGKEKKREETRERETEGKEDIKGIIKRAIRASMEEWKGEIRNTKAEMKEGLERIGREMREREESWRKEKEELKDSIRDLGERLQKLERLEDGDREKGKGKEGTRVEEKEG